VPPAPTFTASNPISGSNYNSPHLVGIAQAGTTVTIYRNSSCIGAPDAFGSDALFASTGLAVNVVDNTFTTFYATATDASSNVSACSSGFTFHEDSSAIEVPTITGSDPASPGASQTPTLMGNTQPGYNIKIYTNSICSGSPVATTTAATSSFQVTVSVGPNSTTIFYATASSGPNTSGCSPGLQYQHLGAMTNTPTETSTPTHTPTNTPTNTLTNTPTGTPTPSLGNYPNASVVLSGNTTVAPDAPPANTTNITVETSTSFVGGELTADPVTGVVRVTNARHANIAPGTYTVTVKAFGPGGTSTKTFLLTVTNGPICNKNAVFIPAPVREVPVINNPLSITIGDFNNDGKQDFVTPHYFTNKVTIHLGDGTGGFASPASPEVIVQNGPLVVGVADLNGDGNQDLAVSDSGSNAVSIRLGDGTGAFTLPPVPELSLNGADILAVGEFNNDGLRDLAVHCTSGIAIFLGTGDGGFVSAPAIPVGADQIGIGDFNNDGNQDLALAFGGTGSVYIRLGNGSGGFTAPAIPSYPIPGGAAGIAIGDFNNDGKQDFATSNGGTGTVSIRLGDGAGAFTSPAVPDVMMGGNVLTVTIGDFDRDGKQDLVSANTATTVALRLGDGSGGFTTPVISAVTGGNGPRNVSVGDFNGDGMQDLAIANAANDNDTVSIRLGACSWILGGTVTYGNAAAPPKYISNATVTGTGSPNVFTTTGAPGTDAGKYFLYGFGEGMPYTVSLSKTTGQNSITSNDAARIAQHVAGISLLPSDIARVTADVTGNNAISSQDAAKIAQFVAGLPFSPPNLTGQWRFYVPPGPTFPVGSSPTSRTYASVDANALNEDFVGLLLGEVTGNWVPGSARPRGPERNSPIYVDLPDIVSPAGKNVVVPVDIRGIADKDVVSYEFDLRYDPSVIQPVEDSVEIAGTISHGLNVVANPQKPGLLRVVMYGPLPIDHDGLLLNLRFSTVAGPGSISQLSFERIRFNEGESRVTATGGKVELTINQ